MTKIKKAKTVEEKLELRKQYRKIPRRDPMDKNFKRLTYVRYADDFLIGVIGSCAQAKEIMLRVSNFLKENLYLQLNHGKTKLTHARKERAHFLGTDISWNSSINKKVVMRKAMGVQSRKKVRVQSRIR
jgi:hypothetical protein